MRKIGLEGGIWNEGWNVMGMGDFEWGIAGETVCDENMGFDGFNGVMIKVGKGTIGEIWVMEMDRVFRWYMDGMEVGGLFGGM